ncbi:helix-turn-helix domain-containing protein [Pseudoxanthomonas sp. SL93]|uniref:GlxA family transcriptional regulator n=1 Tax=Pseudoxanthomonas sp. SL93 TaxID=2995142 RepID=UPI002270A377|nr:helix-turn-helix domain-containing protein [Pseudoxanthomonas sp. SL93]WAC64719.1 helix-turn-helix domain-containing protein [Pseudoxanthomonas sp. SL93]
MTRRDPPTIALLATHGAAASVLYGMYDLFNSAGRDWPAMIGQPPGTSVFRPVVVARDTAPLPVINGIVVTPEVAMRDLPSPDFICIPDLAVYPSDIALRNHDEEAAWLRACHARGSVIAAACTGALLLADTGLLDGNDATTHWAYCEAMAARHPRVKVHPQRVVVTAGQDQRLVMGGGGSSWQDLALYLIARVAGIECAMQTARVFLIDWHQNGQQPFASLARSRTSSDAVISQCQVWIAEHYDTPAPVAGMLQASGLAERTFTRRFQQATGLSPIEYVHTLRLEEAKQQLESADAPVEAIAQSVGYEDAAYFSRLFKRKVGLSPAQYRRRFGGMRRMLQDVTQTSQRNPSP